MLNTVEFGKIRIMSCHKLTMFDTCIGQDIVNEWNFFQLPDGEIVAVENDEEFWAMQARL